MGACVKKFWLILGSLLLIFPTLLTSHLFAAEDVTGNIQFINSRLYYDRGTKQFDKNFLWDGQSLK